MFFVKFYHMSSWQENLSPEIYCLRLPSLEKGTSCHTKKTAHLSLPLGGMGGDHFWGNFKKQLLGGISSTINDGIVKNVPRLSHCLNYHNGRYVIENPSFYNRCLTVISGKKSFGSFSPLKTTQFCCDKFLSIAKALGFFKLLQSMISDLISIFSLIWNKRANVWSVWAHFDFRGRVRYSPQSETFKTKQNFWNHIFRHKPSKESIFSWR